MDSKIAIKYTTDSPEVVASNISAGQSEACVPGELVLSAQSGSARIITLNENDIGVHFQGVLSNGNKGSVTVSSGGEGSTSILLNTSSVTTSALVNDSITEEKINGTVLITKGGTGQATSTAAINALLPSQTGNQNTLLTSNGTNTSWARASLSIDQLNDVDTSSATRFNGQLLRWNQPTLQWKQSENVAIFSDELPTNQQLGRPGQVALGEEYFYVCQGTNRWSRTALQTWNDGAVIRSPGTSAYILNYEPIVFRADQYYSSVSMLLHMNGANNTTTFADSSSNVLAISRSGSTINSTAQSKFGGASGFFDGSGDYLSATSTVLALAQSDHTIEGWVRLSALPTTKWGFAYNGNPLSNDNRIQIEINPTGTVNVYLQAGTGTGLSTTTTTALAINTWYHIAYTKSGNNIKVFIDGIESASSTYSTTIATNNNFYVGWTRSGSTNYSIHGYIDEFRVTKGVARYTANFTPLSTPFPEIGYISDPSFANVSLLLHADGQNGSNIFQDYGASGLNIFTGNNAIISTTRSKFGDSSLFLDGAGSYLSLLNASPLQFGTGDFSIEFWFYAESLNALYPTILANGNTSFSGGAGTFAWYIMVSGSPRKLRMGTNASNPNISSDLTIVPGTWYHVAITRQSNTVRMWIDGVYQNNTTLNADLNISNNGLLIGKNGWDGANGFWHGYIDELRITKGVSRYSTSVLGIPVPSSAFPNA